MELEADRAMAVEQTQADRDPIRVEAGAVRPCAQMRPERCGTSASYAAATAARRACKELIELWIAVPDESINIAQGSLAVTLLYAH